MNEPVKRHWSSLNCGGKGVPGEGACCPHCLPGVLQGLCRGGGEAQGAWVGPGVGVRVQGRDENRARPPPGHRSEVLAAPPTGASSHLAWTEGPPQALAHPQPGPPPHC